jgi:hypothetical protein
MKWPMLTRRRAVYYHRQIVPLALRPFLENRYGLGPGLPVMAEATTRIEYAGVLSWSGSL